MPHSLPKVDSRALGELLEALPVGVCALGDDGRIVWANRHLATKLGTTRDAVVGRPVQALPLEGATAGIVDGRPYRVENRRPESARRLVCTSHVLAGAGDDPVRLRFFSEPPHRKDSVPTLTAAVSLKPAPSQTDAESGALDRPAILQVLQSEVTRSRRYYNPLSVALLTVVGMDENGPGGDHPSGVMATVGRALEERTRWADNIGRWSADQFLLVLPETRRVAAMALMRKLEEHVEHDHRSLRLAFALAEWKAGEDTTLLLKRLEAEDEYPLLESSGGT